MNCAIRVAKTKTLISFAVTAKLICIFVFAYADCWFSHEAAHLVALEFKRDIYNSRKDISILEHKIKTQQLNFINETKYTSASL